MNNEKEFEYIKYYRSKREINFRHKPTIKSKIIEVLNPNDTLKVIDSTKNWYHVQNLRNGNIGYASKKYIEKVVIKKELLPQTKNNFQNEIIISFIFFFILIVSKIISNKKINGLNSKISEFRPIQTLDKEIEELQESLNTLKEDYTKNTQSLEYEFLNNKEKLEDEYKNARIVYEKLLENINFYTSQNHIIESGLYEPIFDYETSEAYKVKMISIIDSQKKLVKDKKACICETEWTINGSKREGTKSTNRIIRLSLRAFNGECSSLISKVRWNNINNLEERIRKSFTAINKFNEVNVISLTNEYLDLKIKELKITHEYNLKKHEEKEELRNQRAEIREEERARREYEKVQKESELQKKVYEKALEEARKELGLISEEEQSHLLNKISNLENELLIVKEKSERALSMAQQTKRGHVYVVSNLGSFGENIYKIGMTRRLDPYDRVKELGDASVPFLFDTHAMIYTEDAPKLEKILHQKFESKRLNKVNYRKEYFNVTIDEVEECIKENFESEFEFYKNSEASEYKRTLEILKKETNIEIQTKQELNKPLIDNNEFPETLF
ncbi:DUF4041 domain-containing protein [Wenyingzhuangia sp. IMCC45574]